MFLFFSQWLRDFLVLYIFNIEVNIEVKVDSFRILLPTMLLNICLYFLTYVYTSYYNVHLNMAESELKRYWKK